MLRILSHFSESSFTLDPSRTYQEKELYNPTKPVGFWLSDESDFGWSKWCTNENFSLHRLTCRQDFECDLSKWLVLSNTKAILDFTEQYKMEELPSKYSFRFSHINWNKVKAEYGGILITPCDYSAQMDIRAFWYSNWDCASACVWDLTTLRSL